MVYRLEDHPRRGPSGALHERRRPDVERRLVETRTSRARIASDIRTLLIRRNEAAAFALADRVPARAIADVTGMKAIDVKRVAGSMLHVEYAGLPASVHLDRLTAITSELTTALSEREHAEQQLLLDAQEALESGECDVFRVAAAASMTAERVRELLRRA